MADTRCAAAAKNARANSCVSAPVWKTPNRTATIAAAEALMARAPLHFGKSHAYRCDLAVMNASNPVRFWVR